MQSPENGPILPLGLYRLFVPQHPAWFFQYLCVLDFPGGAVDKNPPANAQYMDSIPAPGRFHMLWSN